MASKLREQAVKVLVAVGCKRQTLTESLQSVPSHQQAWVREVCYGVLRHFYTLRAITLSLLDKPLKKKDKDIEFLLMMGIYQLRFMRVPQHAAVKETVDCVLALNKKWARAMVNAVLRNYVRRGEAIVDKLSSDEQCLYEHPTWLIERLQKAWPKHWQTICQTNNQKKTGLCLRVNLQKTSTQDYLDRLTAHGIEARGMALSPSCLVLSESLNVETLPGYAEGLFSVQDLGAQLAVPLLQLKEGDSVLDCCCAPGGKTAHILEQGIALERIIGLDSSDQRMKKVSANLARLDLQAELIVADAKDKSSWWNQRQFNTILLDAPCSATGVIRKHPDIKLLRCLEDVEHIVHVQAAILDALWECLVPGGRLVYVTCSILPEENSQQVARFIAQHPDAKELPIDGKWGVEQPHGRQLIPGLEQTDGFYYAILTKRH